MTNQVFAIIIVLIISNFLIAISKLGENDKQKKVLMTIMWEEYKEVGVFIRKTKTLYDIDYSYCNEYWNAIVILHNDSEVLGLKKGRYGLIDGDFVERLN